MTRLSKMSIETRSQLYFLVLYWTPVIQNFEVDGRCISKGKKLMDTLTSLARDTNYFSFIVLLVFLTDERSSLVTLSLNLTILKHNLKPPSWLL